MSSRVGHRHTGDPPSGARPVPGDHRVRRRVTALLTAAALLAGAAQGAGAQDLPADGEAQLRRQVEVAAQLDPASASNENLIAAVTVIDQLTQTLVARGAEAARSEAEATRRLDEIGRELDDLRRATDDTANRLRTIAVRLYVSPERDDSSLRLLKADTVDEAEQRRVMAEAAAGGSREAIDALKAAQIRTRDLQAEATTLRARAEQGRAERERLFVEHVTASQAQQRLQAEWNRRIAALKGATDNIEANRLGQSVANQRPPADRAAPAPGGRMIKPVNAAIGSRYGQRDGKPHTGVDFPAPTGTPVRAPLGGRVKAISTGNAWNGGYGNWVVLSHPNGLETRHAHLSRVSVSAGQTVGQGEIIGQVGNTGSSTGAHLHFEVLVNGRFQNPLNYL